MGTPRDEGAHNFNQDLRITKSCLIPNTGKQTQQ